MKALFLLWRLYLIGAGAVGLRYATSPALSLLLCAAILFLGVDTIAVLADLRRRGL